MVATIHIATEIGFYFNGMDFVITIDGPEHREVMYPSTHIVMLPRAFRVVGYIHLHAYAVDIGEDMEFTIEVANARGPDALSVGFLTILQTEMGVVDLQPVESIATEVPVHQIFRFQHHKSWITMHGCSNQIERITHSNQIRVGKLIIEQGIGVGAVPIISSP